MLFGMAPVDELGMEFVFLFSAVSDFSSTQFSCKTTSKKLISQQYFLKIFCNCANLHFKTISYKKMFLELLFSPGVLDCALRSLPPPMLDEEEEAMLAVLSLGTGEARVSTSRLMPS
jgi:hypothetical protein